MTEHSSNSEFGEYCTARAIFVRPRRLQAVDVKMEKISDSIRF